jgi:AcrR family transcriptional regulator
MPATTYAVVLMAARRKKVRGSNVPKTERRLQILAAAREVFAKRGYHQTTIDDIVLSAGVARGTFYLYFEDKRAVFSDLIDRFAAKLSMAIERIVTDDATRPVANQVQENIRSVIRTCLSERTMTKILFTGAVGVDPEFDRKIATFYDTVVQLLTESLKDGQTLGIVADGEPRVLAYLSIGAFKELLYQAVILGLSEESAEVLLQQMYNFLRQGYLRVSEVLETARLPRSRRKA